MLEKIAMKFSRKAYVESLLPPPGEGARLHLGCGDIHLEGWVNVDARETSATDLVEDVFDLPTRAKNSTSAIYACHILEHCGLPSNCAMPSYQFVLSRWFSALKPGGVLLVSVPDLMTIFKGLKHYDGHDGQLGFLLALFGGQNYVGNTHYCGFTNRSLHRALESVGFRSVRPFRPFVDDTSAFVLSGFPISLNLAARKPETVSG